MVLLLIVKQPQQNAFGTHMRYDNATRLFIKKLQDGE